jgi:2-oxoglutarate ferredoxin oxidoreductase subunit alpha
MVASELEEENMQREERYNEIKRVLPNAETYLTDDADIILVAYGASSRIARTAAKNARESGIKAGLIRPMTLWPFPDKIIKEASKNAKALLVVEMNCGQMVDDVKLAVECKLPVEFYGRTGGVVPSPGELVGEIKRITGGTR